MASKLKARLKDLTENDESLKVLYYQWGFDELVIGSALKSVIDTFKHYSLHDESHSQQILINIELVLGEQGIKALTASDIWLLLESAYLHDVGMVIPYADKVELLKDGTLIDFLENDASTEAKRILEILKNTSGDASLPAKEALEIAEKFNQIVAESFRKSHADRAKKIIKAPELIGLRSPRTTLISERIWDICADICRLHGSDFEAVMQLPQKQNGIGNDFFHPRLIACLLRIGDLLDLDNNRFCPVMSCLTGHTPRSTKAHQDKHRSIEKLLFDHNNIDITAVCETPEGYDEARKWFDYIEQEINNQTSRWAEIKPNDKFPALPTVGILDVGLKGWDLNGKKRPQFNIAAERALKILQGENIYTERSDVFRELIQNALDATLIRIWLSEFKNINPNPSPQELSTAAKKGYPIVISIEEVPEHCTNQLQCFKITIEDQGIGFSAAELREFQEVGTPASKRSRNRLIAEMPEIMKPTGAFGIGFQSIFTRTNEVTIKTVSAREYHQKEIIIKTDETKAPTTVQIRDLATESDQIYKPHTKIEFNLTTESLPEFSGVIRGSIKPYDPINETGNIALLQCSAEILSAAHGPCPITLKIKNQEIPAGNDIKNGFYYSAKEKIGIKRISAIDESQKYSSNLNQHIYFRWAYCHSKDTHGSGVNTRWLAYDAHIFGYEAAKIMPLNRKNIFKSIQAEIYTKITNAVSEALANSELNNSEFADAFLEMHNKNNTERWKSLYLGGRTLDEITQKNVIIFDTDTSSETIDTHIENDRAIIRLYPINFWSDRTTALLIKHISNATHGAKLMNFALRAPSIDPASHTCQIEFTRSAQHEIDLQTFMAPFLSRLKEHYKSNNNDYIFKRFLLPTSKRFDKLSIKKSGINEAIGNPSLGIYSETFPTLIFPFTIKEGEWAQDDTATLQKIVEYTFQYRTDKETTKQQIEDCYEQYIAEIGTILPA